MQNHFTNHLIKLSRIFQQKYNARNPNFFQELSTGQAPPILWLGSSDSRVDPHHILDSEPGKIFVHRNLANQVDVNDCNIMSAIVYSVQVLGVKYVVVCGHSNCQGVSLACDGIDHLPVNMNKVLTPVRSVFEKVLEEHGIDESQWKAFGSEERKSVEEIVAKYNVMSQIENLMSLDFIEERVNDDRLEVIPMYFRMETGLLESL